jgi:hypothetical protein
MEACFQPQLALLHQPAADRQVGMAVLLGVADALVAAVGQLDASRALYLQEEQLDRIGDPEERLAGEGGRLRGEFRARPVGDHLAPVEAAAQAEILQLRIQLAQIDHQQVVGHAVDGVGERLAPLSAAAQQRLVIAGDEALARLVRVHHPPGAEARLEETAQRGILRRQRARFLTRRHARPAASPARCMIRAARHAPRRRLSPPQPFTSSQRAACSGLAGALGGCGGSTAGQAGQAAQTQALRISSSAAGGRAQPASSSRAPRAGASWRSGMNFATVGFFASIAIAMDDLSRLIKRAEALLERLETLLPRLPPRRTGRPRRPSAGASAAAAAPRTGGAAAPHPPQGPAQRRRAEAAHRAQHPPVRRRQDANNVLLTGARGTGKSSLVKALLNQYAGKGLRLIEVDKHDLVDLPDIVDLVASRRSASSSSATTFPSRPASPATRR